MLQGGAGEDGQVGAWKDEGGGIGKVGSTGQWDAKFMAGCWHSPALGANVFKQLWAGVFRRRTVLCLAAFSGGDAGWGQRCSEISLCCPRLFGGLLRDIQRKAPWYGSDFSDALHPQCLSAVLYIYLATVTNAITFGGMLGDATSNMQVSVAVGCPAPAPLGPAHGSPGCPPPSAAWGASSAPGASSALPQSCALPWPLQSPSTDPAVQRHVGSCLQLCHCRGTGPGPLCVAPGTPLLHFRVCWRASWAQPLLAPSSASFPASP